MQFKKYLSDEAKLINREIEGNLNKELIRLKKIHPGFEELFDQFFSSVGGGKRIRGVLISLGYSLTKAKLNREVYKIASAFEVFQTAILIHDDIIDESELRRGEMTLYKKIGHNHYGDSQAICLADFGFFFSSQIITTSAFSEKQKIKALSVFNKVVLDTVLGEILDLKLPFNKEYSSESDSLLISYLKTAQYSFVGPLQIGAILAGGSKELINNLEVFGKNLGIAFQIKDDVLGCFGDEAMLGKSQSSDIKEGKATLLIAYALANANPKQKKILEKYGNQSLGQNEIDEIKKMFLEVGALDYAEAKALEYIEAARTVISKITKDKEKQEILAGLTSYLIERRS